MEFLFIGWCNGVDKRTGVKHDKVWTVFKVGDDFFAGWGARGKTLSFKNHGHNRWSKGPTDALRKLMFTKEKDYKKVDAFHLFSVFPNFEDTVDKQLMFKMLANKVL